MKKPPGGKHPHPTTTASTTASTAATTTTASTAATTTIDTTTATTTASTPTATTTTASTTTESTTATTTATTASKTTATASTSTTAYRTTLSTTTSKGTSEIGYEATTQITNATSYPRSSISTTAINKGTESASRQSAIIAGPTVGVVVIVTVVLVLFCILHRRKKSARAEKKSNGLNTHNIAYQIGSHTEVSTLPKPVDGGSEPPIYIEFLDEENVYNEPSDDAQCPQSSPDETDNYNRILFNGKQFEIDSNYERLCISTLTREQPEYSHIAPTSVCRANVGVNYHRVGPHKPGSNTTKATCFEEQYGVYNHLNDHVPNQPMSRSQKEEETDNQYSHLGQTNYKQGLGSKQVPKEIMEFNNEVENNKQSTVRNGIPAYDAVSNMTVCNVKVGSNLPGPTTLDYELPGTF